LFKDRSPEPTRRARVISVGPGPDRDLKSGRRSIGFYAVLFPNKRAAASAIATLS
jgi:hypothetical protein